jgi:hypothetical protein
MKCHSSNTIPELLAFSQGCITISSKTVVGNLKESVNLRISTAAVEGYGSQKSEPSKVGIVFWC